MEPTHGDYDISEVDGFSNLLEALDHINAADSHEERVERVAEVLMNGHTGSAGYLTFGNNKVAKNVGIFNMNAATDCPNADSSADETTDTGACQVPWSDCYAHQSENNFPNTLPKRRRQEYLWDNIDAQTFADALLRVKERKNSAFEYLRVSEAGDFRHNADIIKWERIARQVDNAIGIYTYSASHKLNWSEAKHFVVNQSNALADYGDRLFSAVLEAEDVPSDAIFCPFEAADKNGVEGDDRPKCGECTACIEPDSQQERDVFITIH